MHTREYYPRQTLPKIGESLLLIKPPIEKILYVPTCFSFLIRPVLLWLYNRKGVVRILLTELGNHDKGRYVLYLL